MIQKKPSLEKSLQKYIEAKKAALDSRSITITKKDDLWQILQVGGPSLLVCVRNLSNQANALIKFAQNQGVKFSIARPVFYIDSPEKIDISKQTIKIRPEDGEIIIDPKGFFADFLTETRAYIVSQGNVALPPLLVVNWSSFSAAQRVAANTMLDEIATINGEKLDGIKIVSLCDRDVNDISFISRHQEVFSIELDSVEPSVSREEAAVIKVDLEGFDDWQSKLFGEIYLEGNKNKWRKSDFVRSLEDRKGINFVINNCAKNKDLEYFLAQAKVFGYLSYQGYKIHFGQEVVVRVENKSFDFSQFSSERIKIWQNVTIDKGPKNCHIINPQLFDLLLFKKEIADGGYRELDGLIKAAAAKLSDEMSGEVLRIFISDDLTKAQYYCLFRQAQEQNIHLEIFLAPQIRLFDDIARKVTIVESEVVCEEKSEIFAGILFSSDCTKSMQKALKNSPMALVVDVEDCAYQDLFTSISFKITGHDFTDFKERESQFIQFLKNGKKIILKGEFSDSLLQMLKPHLVEDYAKNLLLIIENKKSLAKTTLSWLDKRDYFVDVFEVSADAKNVVEEPRIEDGQEFIKKRQEIFLAALSANQMVALVGKSGVGKSSLVAMYEQDPQYKIYRDFDDLASWAEDESEQTKILFIDESNIVKSHLTMFEQLKNGGNKTIFYQGRFYQLSDKHKVVFACNPKEFGGGRVDQKLFSDNAVLQIRLQHLSSEYIYQLLQDDIYDKFDYKGKTEDFRQKFKSFCLDEIGKYQQVLGMKREITIRELQEYALKYLAKAACRARSESRFGPDESLCLQTGYFVSTSATIAIERDLFECLRVREFQQKNILPQGGTNGILLEGLSGLGKSSMIKAYLETYKKGEYIKIESNLPYQKQEELIIEAFENGQIIWIDELDSCVNNGIEKLLNSVLDGVHPKIKDFKPRPGFMLIASVNGISEEGRYLIGPALRHRLHCPRLSEFTEYTQSDIESIFSSWFTEFSLRDSDVEASAAERSMRSEIMPALPQFLCDLAKEYCELPSDLKNQMNLRELKRFVMNNLQEEIGQQNREPQEIGQRNPSPETGPRWHSKVNDKGIRVFFTEI